MTVIINELEVATQTEAPPQAPSAPSSSSPTPGLSPFELRSTLRHMSRRAERLRAD